MMLVLVSFTLIALIDLKPLIRRRSWRGMAAFLLLFVPALTLSILQASGVEVPSVMLLLGNMFKAMGLSY